MCKKFLALTMSTLFLFSTIVTEGMFCFTSTATSALSGTKMPASYTFDFEKGSFNDSTYQGEGSAYTDPDGNRTVEYLYGTSVDQFGNTFYPLRTRFNDKASATQVDVTTTAGETRGTLQLDNTATTLLETASNPNAREHLFYIPTDENGYPYIIEPNTEYTVTIKMFIQQGDGNASIYVGGGAYNSSSPRLMFGNSYHSFAGTAGTINPANTQAYLPIYRAHKQYNATTPDGSHQFHGGTMTGANDISTTGDSNYGKASDNASGGIGAHWGSISSVGTFTEANKSSATYRTLTLPMTTGDFTPENGKFTLTSTSGETATFGQYFSIAITKNLALVNIDSITITRTSSVNLDANGGYFDDYTAEGATTLKNTAFTAGDTINVTPSHPDSSVSFAGWSLDGVAVNTFTADMDGKTLKAIWTEEDLSYTFDFDTVKPATVTTTTAGTQFTDQNGNKFYPAHGWSDSISTITAETVSYNGESLSVLHINSATSAGKADKLRYIPTDANGYPYIVEPNTSYTVSVTYSTQKKNQQQCIVVGAGAHNVNGLINNNYWQWKYLNAYMDSTKVGSPRCFYPIWASKVDYTNNGNNPFESTELDFKTQATTFTTGDFTDNNGMFTYENYTTGAYFTLFFSPYDILMNPSARAVPAEYYIDSITITEQAASDSTITFDANGGNFNGESSITATLTPGTAITAEKPTNSNPALTFAGWSWYKDSAITVDTVTSGMNGKTLYAVWEEAEVILPVWQEGAEITISDRTSTGFAASWPSAEGAENYQIYLDGTQIKTVTDTSYIFKGLSRWATDHKIVIKAVNSYGTSSTSLTAKASPTFNLESNKMDIHQIVEGDSTYTNYRIPGMIVTKNDTLIIYYEARTSGSDWAGMDLVAMRSSDKGESFSKPVILVEGVSTGKTINNPVMIAGNDGTIHLLYCVEYGVCTDCNDSALETCPHGCGVFYKKSTNDGVSWSDAVNITASTSPDMRNVIATGPGHGICLKNGTLVVPVWYVPKSAGASLTSHSPSRVASLYSTDNGATWKMGETLPNGQSYSPNETAAAETSDGRVMFYIRTAGNGYRGIAYSSNGYSDWTQIELDTTLIDPTCFGSVVKYEKEGEPYTLLSVNCESKSGRSNLVVKGSSNNGVTWNMRKVITSGGAGYSDIAVDSDGIIYVLYETEWGLAGRLARLSFDCFTNATEEETTDINFWSGEIASGKDIPTDSDNDGYLEIYNGEQLAWFVNNGGKAALMNDIWLNDMTVSVVNGSVVINRLNGEAVTDISTLKPWFVSESDDPSASLGNKVEFKGNGHVINGLYYSSPIRFDETGTSSKRYGLFPAPADQSVISEVGIENSYMLTDSAFGAACLVGQLQNKSISINDCYVADSVYHRGYQVAAILGGGLGSNSKVSTIKNCYSMAHLKAFNSDTVNENRVYSNYAITGNIWTTGNFEVSDCYVGNGAPAYRADSAGTPFATVNNVYFGLDNASITGTNALEVLSGLSSEHWYAVADRTPVLRSRGSAIGDINEDGKFEKNVDGSLLRKSLIEKSSELKNRDVNRDQNANIADLVKLYKLK